MIFTNMIVNNVADKSEEWQVCAPANQLKHPLNHILRSRKMSQGIRDGRNIMILIFRTDLLTRDYMCTEITMINQSVNALSLIFSIYFYILLY